MGKRRKKKEKKRNGRGMRKIRKEMVEECKREEKK